MLFEFCLTPSNHSSFFGSSLLDVPSSSYYKIIGDNLFPCIYSERQQKRNGFNSLASKTRIIFPISIDAVMVLFQKFAFHVYVLQKSILNAIVY